MIEDLMDEPDYERPDVGNATVCFHCHHPTAGESCGFCGNDLCPACWEMGGGFCMGDHNYEQICAYEDMLLGPPDADKLRQRQAHRELVARGVIPPP